TSSSDSGKHLDDKDSSSSSKKEADSSSVTKDKDSSSGLNEKESSLMRIITSSKGNYAIVGDKLMIAIPGVDPESLKIKGKSGVYNCITDEKTGKKTGVVTAVKKGTVKLYQTEGKKKRIVCEIKVEQPKIKKSLKLKVGKTKQVKLTGTKTKPDAWSSSNEEVATVSADGTVCAKSAGTAVVTACINEHEYKCNIVATKVV
ncbi:MAG: Ig-like domain-containing protein, partial [Lachnospiraceae bacterium]|nr:Ig-like domain-containing protein [Lachnospiraceae bacterium]